MPKNYVGVVGESYYFEYPETWFIDIILNIQAVKKGDPILAKAGEYKNKLIKFLIAEGIPERSLIRSLIRDTSLFSLFS